MNPRWETASGKRLDIRLSEEDKWAPERVYKKSPDWRARERAKTLLLLGQGLLVTIQPPTGTHSIQAQA